MVIKKNLLYLLKTVLYHYNNLLINALVSH